MGLVRYAKSLRDLERDESQTLAFPKRAVRTIRCVYETDSELVQAVVPKPLEAHLGSEVCVSFTSAVTAISPDVSIETREASFGVRIDYDDRPGTYVLTMPTSSEHATIVGRERYGEPRKIADLSLDVVGDEISASVERMGIGFMATRGVRLEALGPRQFSEYDYCFKAFPSCTPGKAFDQDPQLVRLESVHDYDQVWRFEGELELRDSPFDPVVDLPIRRVVDFEYAEGSSRVSGRVLRPVPGDWLLPFTHQGYDDPWIEGSEV